MEPTNPLLAAGLPPFASLKPEHVAPAVAALVADAWAVLEAVSPPTPASWDAVVEPLTDAVDRLDRAWGAVAHLNAVADTPEWRQAFNDNLGAITAFRTDVAQHRGLYAQYRALAASPDFGTWSPARRRVVELELRRFRLSGADLDDAGRARFAEVQNRLGELAARFGQNVQDATDDYQLVLPDASRLDGVPADDVAQFADAARKAGKDGYLVTLQAPSFVAVVQHADDRTLREEVCRAYARRASEFGPPEWDNTPVIREWLTLLDEQARLLGMGCYAEVSIATKMVESPAQAVAFVRDLAARARPFADRDRDELRAFARTRGLDTLEAWDRGWTSEKLRQSRYDFSTAEVKAHLPLPAVLDRLFGLLNRLYDVSLVPAPASVWHPDVAFYRILVDGDEVAGVFLDLHARPGKRPGAWMDVVQGRRRTAQGLQLPVAHIVANFPPVIEGTVAHVSHDDVVTLFHEFGHALQHTLTRVDELSISGIANVEWDAVELPSQLMENFCWDRDLLPPLPPDLFAKMLAAKNFQSGLSTVRQLEFGLFDLLLYSDFDPRTGDWLALLRRVRDEVGSDQLPAWNRSPNSFSHIFGGGYEAGYFSYKWAEVLSADAYSAFEEAGGPHPVTGKRFLDEVLAVGATRPSSESFRAFRGRDPELDALLRHSGMAN